MTTARVSDLELSIAAVVENVENLKAIIAAADTAFAKRHPDFDGKPLSRAPELAEAREEWNDLFMQSCLNVLGRYRNAVDAGRFVGSA